MIMHDEFPPAQLAAAEQAIALLHSRMVTTVGDWNQHKAGCDHTDAVMWSMTLQAAEEEMTNSTLALMAVTGVSILARLVREGVIGPSLRVEAEIPTSELHDVHLRVGDQVVTTVVSALKMAAEDRQLDPADMRELVLTSAMSANDQYPRLGMAAVMAAAIHRVAFGTEIA